MSEETTPNQKGGEPTHIVGQPQAAKADNETTAAQPATQQQLADVKKEMSDYERSTVRWMKVTAFIYAVTAMFILLQWKTMGDTLREMRSSGATAANQIWHAIDNMNWLARTADGSLQKTQVLTDATNKLAQQAENSNLMNADQARARIEGRNTRIDKRIQPGQAISVSAYFENMGHSPAFDMRSASDAKYWSDIPDGPMPLKLPQQGPIIEPGIPGYTITWSVPSTAEFLAGLPTDTKDHSRPTVYFFGRFEYLTMGRKHHTEFCFYLISTAGLLAPVPQTIETRYTPAACQRWNSAD